MSDSISLSLRKSLRRLNPRLILECTDFNDGERHWVSPWLRILPWSYLNRDSRIRSDIHNEGRTTIEVLPPPEENGCMYTAFHEPAVTEMIRKRCKYGR